MTNDYYRLKATEFINRLQQIQELIKHNPSRGYIGEELLRDFLKTALPSSVKVTQGFIVQGNEISPQCDIIICDALKYAPIYSFGNIDIVHNESVYAVVEVKTRVDREGFEKILKDFRKLHYMHIQHKILFMYSSRKPKTIESYFYPKSTEDNEFTISDNTTPLYDLGEYLELPEIILSITSNLYFQKDLYQDDSRDYNGYNVYQITDDSLSEISCLQKLLSYLTEIISPANDSVSESMYDTLYDMKLLYGFPIVEL